MLDDEKKLFQELLGVFKDISKKLDNISKQTERIADFKSLEIGETKRCKWCGKIKKLHDLVPATRTDVNFYYSRGVEIGDMICNEDNCDDDD